MIAIVGIDIGAPSIETVCPRDRIGDLVTRAPPAAALRDALNAAGIEVHVAGEAA